MSPWLTVDLRHARRGCRGERLTSARYWPKAAARRAIGRRRCDSLFSRESDAATCAHSRPCLPAEVQRTLRGRRNVQQIGRAYGHNAAGTAHGRAAWDAGEDENGCSCAFDRAFLRPFSCCSVVLVVIPPLCSRVPPPGGRVFSDCRLRLKRGRWSAGGSVRRPGASALRCRSPPDRPRRRRLPCPLEDQTPLPERRSHGRRGAIWPRRAECRRAE